jgi:dihydrofolate reductase
MTHEQRAPWKRPGGTTFHFVNDGIETALDQAREGAGDRNVRVAGGGATILEYVNASLIDDFSYHGVLSGCRMWTWVTP